MMALEDLYFASYAHFGAHEVMLKDDIRTNAYRDAIMQNTDLFEGKVVLDVGCGTGILSMLAAKAGAKKVYAVEFSKIASLTQDIVKDNKLDHIVKVINCKVEELVLPDGEEKVDILLSEWMGYCLLYEGMIESVIYARDKWLKPGGIMFPGKASMFICSIEDHDGKQDNINWWNNVYGFDMSRIRTEALSETLVASVTRDKVCTNHTVVFEIDMHTVTTADLTFKSDFNLMAKRDDCVHAMVVWFSVEFNKCQHPIRLSTAPEDGITHWKQTIFYLDQNIPVNRGEILYGTFSCSIGTTNKRDPHFEISINFSGRNSQCKTVQKYKGDYSIRIA